MRQQLVVGNWKMNGSIQQIHDLVGGVTAGCAELPNQVQVGVCPPFVYLSQVKELVKDSAVLLGAQDVSQYPGGAYTGEIACGMLQDFSVETVIVGHSERRQLFAETNELVAEKFAIVKESGMQPILCVGETLVEREQNATMRVVLQQLEAVVSKVGIEGLEGAVVAYEPVWAIGTGRTASPEQAQEVHAGLREFLAQQNEQIAGDIRIIYGGSVKSSNARELFDQTDIDGGLVGGASLDAEEFIAICASAD